MSDAQTKAPPEAEQLEQEHMGQRLKEAREYLGFSQEVIAEKLGVPRASISAMENGKRKVTSLELKRLSHLYRRPLQYFLGDDEPENPTKNDTIEALFRTTKALNDTDRAQVLKFAQFLQHAGRAPRPADLKPEGSK